MTAIPNTNTKDKYQKKEVGFFSPEVQTFPRRKKPNFQIVQIIKIYNV